LTGINKLTNFALLLIIAAYAPSAFAVPELKLSSGGATVDILEASVKDSCPVADCVTYIGAVGSWQVDVTTGIEGGLPFFDINSINAIRSGGQKSPLTTKTFVKRLLYLTCMKKSTTRVALIPAMARATTAFSRPRSRNEIQQVVAVRTSSAAKIIR